MVPAICDKYCKVKRYFVQGKSGFPLTAILEHGVDEKWERHSSVVKIRIHLNVPLLETALNPIKVGRIEVISSTLRDILGIVDGNLLQVIGVDDIPLLAEISNGHCEPDASTETVFERRSILVDP